ncbi:hypothetical protein CQ054_20695 [Ochrobactrum sp. MYb29]|nr:hypothetical protein CQ054_20695 [Ochrobactrum sp. MYb29]
MPIRIRSFDAYAVGSLKKALLSSAYNHRYILAAAMTALLPSTQALAQCASAPTGPLSQSSGACVESNVTRNGAGAQGAVSVSNSASYAGTGVTLTSPSGISTVTVNDAASLMLTDSTITAVGGGTGTTGLMQISGTSALNGITITSTATGTTTGVEIQSGTLTIGSSATGAAHIAATSTGTTTGSGTALRATGNGAIINATDAILEASGQNTDTNVGAFAMAGTINLTGGSITASGSNSDGLWGLSGTTITADGVNIQADSYGAITSGTISLGLDTRNPSAPVHTTINAGTIGVYATGGRVTGTDVEVTSGDWGVVVIQAGTVDLTGGSIDAVIGALNDDLTQGGTFTGSGVAITTTGTGVNTAGANSVSTLQDNGSTHTTIKTSNNATGILVRSGGQVTGSGVVVDASGRGIDAGGANTQVTLQDGSSGGNAIVTAGGTALHVTTGATAIGTNAVLTSTGTAAGNAYGAYADAASIDLTGGSVTARGSNGAGLAVTGSGNINTTATNVTATGANSSGILGLGAGEVTMVGGSLIAEQGDLVRSEGGALDVTLDTVLTGTGSGMVLNVLDDAAGNHGSVNLSALNTILDGDIFAAADNIANVSLSGSELTGAANNATNISLDAGSLWNMTASSTVSDTVTNAGMIAFSAPDAGVFKTLTTTNYVGDNGTVVLNTTLGANASPSDQIVINGGTASGQTGLAINNINGTGAPTTDGIKVVDAINGGTTTADAFFLGNGDYVTNDGQNAKIAGAYAYTLHRSPIISGTDVYGDSYAANDWYLRSILTNPVDPVVPTSPQPPRYQPGVPVYENYPNALQVLNRLPTLAQRTGNRYWGERAPAETVFCKNPAQNFRCTPTQDQNAYYQDGATTIVGGMGVWGRIEGLHGRQQPNVTTSQSDYEYDMWKLQAGVDGQLYENDAGKLIGGVTVHYGQVSTDITSVFGNGNIDTTGYGFGGTLTWYGNNGFYLDAQGQVTWYDSDLYSDTLRQGLADGSDGFGYALSLEAGKRIALNENWILTPQAQLTWSTVDFDSFIDPYGARVSLDKGDSLKGRLGLALGHEHSWKNDDGQTSRAQVYGIVNLTNEFLDGTRVDVSGTKFDSRADRLTGGVGLGGTYSWANDKYAVFGEVSADTSLKNFSDSYEVGGTLGLRVKF